MTTSTFRFVPPAAPVSSPNEVEESGPSHNWVGYAMERTEDDRLIRGRGQFVADLAHAGLLHATVLRSPVAAGRIRNLDVSAAKATAGVVAVLTAEDARRDGLGGIPWEVCPPGLEGKATFPGDPAVAESQPLLAHARVRYVGEPVAVVIGETSAAAQDGAEAIGLDIEPDEAVADVKAAMERGLAGSSRPALLFTHAVGDVSLAEQGFRNAALVVEIETHIPRLVPSPMEARCYVAHHDQATGHSTLWGALGKPHPVRDALARNIFRIDPAHLCVIAPDIGGGFGGKNVLYAEAALVLWAAQGTGRPVSWICGRNEAFLSDMQGRDHAVSAQLATDAAGRFLAIRYESYVNLGAYLAPRGVMPCLNGLKVLTGPYKIDALSAQVSGVFTNTVPTCPYRGAGAPETAFVVERLIDMAARRLRLPPDDIRRRNLIRPEDLPWRAPTGLSYHSVDFPMALDRLPPPRGHGTSLAANESRPHRRRGVGLAFTVEGYGPAFDEAAEIMVDGSGCIELRIGTKSAGQSHETSYVQVAADALGLDPSLIRVVQGDTERIARGNGTGASRSLTVGGSAILTASAALLDKARATAAQLLQCAPERLLYRNGHFFVSSGGGSISLASIAQSFPNGQLHVSASFRPAAFTFPGGCHRAEVEVDIETGEVFLLRYDVVHDAGVAVNPAVVHGQLHGGIAQGAGSALMEVAVYDKDSAQPLAATFLDYAMPRAADFPEIGVELLDIPCSSNLIGAKPVGEAGTVGAPPAIVNAIVDALADLGVEHIELPATPERVWRALRQARAERARDTNASCC
jgi:carbon-monoxide dehydrogenase large subunit